jgi:ribonuclease P protein component
MAFNSSVEEMTRKWALKKRAHYQMVYRLGTAWSDRNLVVKALKNNLDFSRYGFSVNKPLGNAVVRNHIKRLLKEGVRSIQIKAGWDIVFIARQGSKEANYHQLRYSVIKLLTRAELLLNENEVINCKVN